MKLNKKTIGLAVGMACTTMMTLPAQAFEFSAFGDTYLMDATNDTRHFGFGGLDLFVRHDIDPSTEALIEYVFENDGSSFVLDVERLYIKRKINENFSVGAGRFHSPLGYWNNTYHHGVLLQDTVTRPSFLDFEDGEAAILPTHAVGLDLTGKAGPLGYEVSIGNSTFLDTSPAAAPPEIGIGNVGDYSDDKTIFAHLTYDIADVNLGLSLMNNSIVESNPLGTRGVAVGDELIGQTVTGLDARYSYDKLDVLAEYFMMTNDSQATLVGDGKSHDATAYYVQASYQVNDKFRPTYRYESLSFDATDDYFVILGRSEYTASVVALRYELDESNAVSLEYKSSDVGGNTETHAILDWAFLLL